MGKHMRLNGWQNYFPKPATLNPKPCVASQFDDVLTLLRNAVILHIGELRDHSAIFQLAIEKWVHPEAESTSGHPAFDREWLPE